MKLWENSTTIKESLDGISQNLSDLTSEFRQLNNNRVQVDNNYIKFFKLIPNFEISF